MRGMHNYGNKGTKSDKSSGSSMKAGGAKQVKAGKGTIRTPFSRAIIRDIGRSTSR